MKLSRSLSLTVRRYDAETRRVSLEELRKLDPFQESETEIDKSSSKSNPMVLTAYGNERAIMCVCKDVSYLVLQKGPPVQCNCGHWFQLVDAEKFWLEEKKSKSDN